MCGVRAAACRRPGGGPCAARVPARVHPLTSCVRARGVCLSQPLPGDDPKQRKPDITKARKFLKWEPKIPLEQGIVKAAEYFKSLDLSRFKKPTKHDAHKNTDELEQSKKRQKTK